MHARQLNKKLFCSNTINNTSSIFNSVVKHQQIGINKSILSQYRFGSSSSSSGEHHGEDHHHHEEFHSKPARVIYAEEYLNIARNWPKEQFDPDQFEKAFKATDNLHPNLGHAKEFPDGTDIHTKADFSSPFWTKLIGSALLIAILVRSNDYYFGDTEVHPFVKLIKSFKEDSVTAEQETRKWFDIYARQAEDNLILKDYTASPTNEVYRLKCPDIVFKRSDWSAIPGEDIDFSNVKWKYSWQEDDKYFGVPYPKSE